MRKVLIIGLGNPAVPEQMAAPEKSMQAADTGGGGTAFSEIMSRVTEGKEDKNQAAPERKAEETAEKKTADKKKPVAKSRKNKENKPEDLKAAAKEPVVASTIPAGEIKAAEKPETAVKQAAATGLTAGTAVSEEGIKIDGGESVVQTQAGITAGKLLTADQGRQNGKPSDQDSKKEKSKLKIIDTRRQKGIAGAKQAKAEKGVEIEKPSTEDSLREGTNRERQFIVVEKDTGDGKAQDIFKPASSQITKSDQTALFKHLQETANDKIVRQAGIILKDNNTGELRLVLKPEKMGTVRIRLELQDNHIAGKIFVDNSSVKDVFDHNLEALYRAFRESGYETSGLNVTVGNGNDGNSNKQGRGIPKGTLEMLEDFVPSADEVFHADYLVNLVV